MSGESDLLTIGEAAGVLRLKASTVRAWLLQRRLPFVKLGRRVFLRRADLQELVAASVIPAQSKAGERRNGKRMMK